MKEITELQRDIYDLPKSPPPGSSRAVSIPPTECAILFSYWKATVDDQALDHAAQTLSFVGGGLGSNVGWSIWGRFLKIPGV